MKRRISTICCLVLVFLMAACGRGNIGQQPQETLEANENIESQDGNVQESIVSDIDGGSIAEEDTSKKMNPDEEMQDAGEIQTQGEETSQEHSAETEYTDSQESFTETQEEVEGKVENKVTKMTVQVGDTVFTATLEDNQAVSELVAIMREAPVTIEMSDYSGFEKVGGLGTSLTTSNSQTTTQAGDIVLYNGNQIVIFYGSNSWSYTRLGKIDDLSGWEEALGSGDVTVTFSME